MDSTYLKNNPTWHVEDSPWKAMQIYKMISRNDLTIKSVCELGCGAGEVLNKLSSLIKADVAYYGYEISPHAYELCKKIKNNKVHYYLADLTKQSDKHYDLLLCIDIIEHIEDYYSFLDSIKKYADYHIFHIPLDLSALGILRNCLMLVRNKIGHIHFFTKETALATLNEAGYTVIDHFLTDSGIALYRPSIKRRLMRIPRKLLFFINNKFAVRLLGGWSLMVLCKPSE